MVNITIVARTMEGFPAEDQNVVVDIVETTGLQRQVVNQVLASFHGTAVLHVPDPPDFPMWRVSVLFPRFDAGAAFTFMPRGEPNPSHLFQVARLPGQWTPAFELFADLASPRFDPFVAAVAISDNVDLKNGPAVGDLQAGYDGMAGDAQVLAKAALLNLYAVLRDEVDPIGKVPWFSYVRKFIRLDQERFLAEVSPTLFENVHTIVNQLTSTYAALGYSTESPADLALFHLANIPAAYLADPTPPQGITVKKAYEQGNVQLTLWSLRLNGVAVTLLDCDMDEHLNFIKHSFDILLHLFNGGTNPIAIHEYIVEDSAQAHGGIATVDLGYTLV